MPDDAIEARKKAMDLLARREHARAELERKLAAAGFDAEVAADAVEKLAQEGLQSDRRFVESFVQSRISQGKGPMRIHADLGQRGIAAGLVDEVLEQTGEDWYARAREARVKKFGRSRPAEFRDKARQMRFLQYRGFEPDQVQAAVASFEE
jgi:regulatory protein